MARLVIRAQLERVKPQFLTLASLHADSAAHVVSLSLSLSGLSLRAYRSSIAFSYLSFFFIAVPSRNDSIPRRSGSSSRSQIAHDAANTCLLNV